MDRKHRFILKAIAIACLFLTFFDVLAFQDKELVVWHSYRGQEKEAMLTVIEQFNKKVAGKGIKVKGLAIPYDAYPDKVTAAIPRGKGPDIFIFAQDRLGGWIEAGNTVEPLDFYLEDNTEDLFVEGALEAMTYRDTIYGLPFNYKCITMIYNKKLVKNPPKTSSELVELAKTLTNPAAGEYGLAYSYGDFFYHASLMNGFGGGVFKDGQPVLDQPKNVEAVKLMLKWLNEDKIMPEEPSTALITSLFNKGKAAIVFNGPWFLGEIEPSVDYDLALLPTLNEAGGKPMKPWMTVEGIYIAEPSKHKDEAFEFVKYATSVEAAKVMAMVGRQTPAVKAVYEEAEVAEDPLLKKFMAQAAVAEPMPNVPEMTMVWSPATTAMNLIIKGSATPEQAFSKAQEQVATDVTRLRKGN